VRRGPTAREARGGRFIAQRKPPHATVELSLDDERACPGVYGHHAGDNFSLDLTAVGRDITGDGHREGRGHEEPDGGSHEICRACPSVRRKRTRCWWNTSRAGSRPGSESTMDRRTQ